MILETRTVVLIFLAGVCLAALFFLDVPVRVDRSATIPQETFRQIQAVRIPKPSFTGTIREQLIHVDKENPRLRTEIQYQGSASLAASTVGEAGKVTQGMRDQENMVQEQRHQRDLLNLYKSCDREYAENEEKQTQYEEQLNVKHSQEVARMNRLHQLETQTLKRRIDKGIELLIDSDSD